MSASSPHFSRITPADRAGPEESGASSSPLEGRLILDWSDQADLLAWAISNDRPKLADRWFARHGYDRPTILWSFRREEIADPSLMIVFDHWLGLIKGDPTPDYQDVTASFDCIDRSIASLLLAMEGGRDFRYVRFAGAVAHKEGEDWTGRRLSEFAVRSYRGVFYLALYRAMIQRRSPCLIRHQTDDQRPGSAFLRLLAPLGGADGRVVGFLNANCYEASSATP
jgi:hypothetical protein